MLLNRLVMWPSTA